MYLFSNVHCTYARYNSNHFSTLIPFLGSDAQAELRVKDALKNMSDNIASILKASLDKQQKQWKQINEEFKILNDDVRNLADSHSKVLSIENSVVSEQKPLGDDVRKLSSSLSSIVSELFHIKMKQDQLIQKQDQMLSNIFEEGHSQFPSTPKSSGSMKSPVPQFFSPSYNTPLQRIFQPTILMRPPSYHPRMSSCPPSFITDGVRETVRNKSSNFPQAGNSSNVSAPEEKFLQECMSDIDSGLSSRIEDMDILLQPSLGSGFSSTHTHPWLMSIFQHNQRLMVAFCPKKLNTKSPL